MLARSGAQVETARAALPVVAQACHKDFRREDQMAKGKSLDGRHRDKSGRIDRKHGNTRVGTLRKEYGDSFAKGRRKDMMLKTLLKETGTTSLHEYLRQRHR
jgi:hypothetical protein